jgi:chromosome segregation ATPase
MIKFYLIIFIMATVSSVGYGGYRYVTNLQEQVIILKENNVKLQIAAETLQNTVNSLKENAEKNAELNKNLTKRLQQSQEHLDKIRGVFAKIDLTMEALTDAANLEERVNNAVAKLINKIEIETTPPSDVDTAASSVQPKNTGTGSSTTN